MTYIVKHRINRERRWHTSLITIDRDEAAHQAETVMRALLSSHPCVDVRIEEEKSNA